MPKTYPISDTPLTAVFFSDETGQEIWREEWKFKRAMGAGETFIRNYVEFVVTNYDRDERHLFFTIRKIADRRPQHA